MKNKLWLIIIGIIVLLTFSVSCGETIHDDGWQTVTPSGIFNNGKNLVYIEAVTDMNGGDLNATLIKLQNYLDTHKELNIQTITLIDNFRDAKGFLIYYK